jgi:hypothetical protein
MAMTFTIASAARDVLSGVVRKRVDDEAAEDERKTRAYEEVSGDISFQARIRTRITIVTSQPGLSRPDRKSQYFGETFSADTRLGRSQEEERHTHHARYLLGMAVGVRQGVKGEAR